MRDRLAGIPDLLASEAQSVPTPAGRDRSPIMTGWTLVIWIATAALSGVSVGFVLGRKTNVYDKFVPRPSEPLYGGSGSVLPSGLKGR